MELKRWYGSEPKNCENCLGSLQNEEHFYDSNHHSPYAGRLIWGLLCEDCFNKHGIGLGIGRGQKYINKPPYFKVDDQLLQVVATYDDGSEEDITDLILKYADREG